MEENILHCRMEAVDLPSDRKVALITGITGNTIHTNTCIHTYKKTLPQPIPNPHTGTQHGDKHMNKQTLDKNTL